MASPTNPKPSPADTEERSRPRFEERIEGDPFEVLNKYEEVTLPPHQRLKWMSAPLPSAPQEVLQDTVPPNGGVKAPPKPQAEAKPEAAPPVEIERKPVAVAPSLEPLSEQETELVPRVRHKRRLRQVVLLSVGTAMMLTLVGVGLSLSNHGTSEQAPALVARPSTPEAAKPNVEATPRASTHVAAPATSDLAALPSPSADISQPDNTRATPRRKPPARDLKPAASAPPTSRAPVTNGFDTSKPWED